MELKDLVEKLAKEWEAFKQENDRRLKEIESKGRADPLTEEKINKHSAAIGELQKSLDTMNAKLSRPGVGADAETDKAAHKKAFDLFMRKGDTSALEEFHQKAGINLGTDSEGGYLVPSTLDSEIEKYERDNAPMRQVCRVIALSNERFEKLVKQDGTGMSGWVDELEARAETGTGTWNALTPYFGEIYANPGVSQKALDDAMLNLEAEIAEDVGMEFAEQENDAFTTGNGVKKPKGILGYTLAATADGSRAFGQIEKVHSGSSGAFVADKVIDLCFKLKRGYRQNAMWMTSAPAVAELRKLKDGQNNYLFQPSYVAGTPQMLLGYPIMENDDVPVPAANANAMLFGDFRRAYYIVDVRGVRMLRDPFTNKPKVMFYTTKRVGGFLVNDRAVKVYTLST